MTAIAHGWDVVSRHKIVDAIVVLLAAVTIAVVLMLTLGNQSAGGSGGTGAHPSVPVRHAFVPNCHWTGKPTAC